MRPPHMPRELTGKHVLIWFVGFFGFVFVVNAMAYFAALRTVPASVVALVLYTYPVLVTLLSALLGFEALTVRALLAAALAFGGTALTAGGAVAVHSAAGLAFALLAALGYSVYMVLSSRLAAGVGSEEAARHVSETCAVVFIVFAAMRGELSPPPSVAGWLAVLGIAVVCTVFALRAFLAGMARVGPSRAAVASSVEVIVTVILAVAILHETVDARQGVGAALILAGVAVHSLGPLRRRLD